MAVTAVCGLSRRTRNVLIGTYSGIFRHARYLNRIDLSCLWDLNPVYAAQWALSIQSNAVRIVRQLLAPSPR
jgi:hypothetical protein